MLFQGNKTIRLQTSFVSIKSTISHYNHSVPTQMPYEFNEEIVLTVECIFGIKELSPMRELIREKAN
jgi:hypothetical protein